MDHAIVWHDFLIKSFLWHEILCDNHHPQNRPGERKEKNTFLPLHNSEGNKVYPYNSMTWFLIIFITVD